MKITDDMLTEWFPASICNPVHEGEYETRTKNYPKPKRLLFENGRWWGFLQNSGKFASGFAGFDGAAFRGLKEKHHG